MTHPNFVVRSSSPDGTKAGNTPQLYVSVQLQPGMSLTNVSGPAAPTTKISPVSADKPAPTIETPASIKQLQQPQKDKEEKKGGGFWSGVGNFFYTLVCEDFVNAAKGIGSFIVGSVNAQMNCMIGIGKFLTGDVDGAMKSFSAAAKDFSNGLSELVKNSISILFAALTIAAIVGTAGAGAAAVVGLRALAKQGFRMLAKELCRMGLEKVGYTALKGMFEAGFKAGMKNVGKIALKWGMEKTGIATLKEVFQFGFKEGMKTIAEFGLRKTGIHFVRGLFNEGPVRAAGRLWEMSKDATAAGLIKAGKWTKLHERTVMAQDIMQDTEQLAKILGKSITQDVVELEKAMKKSHDLGKTSEMAETSQNILRKRIEKAKGKLPAGQELSREQVQDILSTMVRDNGNVSGATRVLSNSVADITEQKALKVLKLIEEGSYDSKYIEKQLRLLKVAEEDIAEAKRIITARHMKVGVRSRGFDKDMLECMTSNMQNEAQVIVRQKVASGELGSVYREEMDTFFDGLTKGEKPMLTENEANMFKEEHAKQIEEIYVQGVRDGIARGVKQAFIKLRQMEKPYFTLPEIADERKKRKGLEWGDVELIDNDKRVGVDKHTYHKAEQAETTQHDRRASKKHWENEYYEEKAKEDAQRAAASRAQGGRSSDTQPTHSKGEAGAHSMSA